MDVELWEDNIDTTILSNLLLKIVYHSSAIPFSFKDHSRELDVIVKL